MTQASRVNFITYLDANNLYGWAMRKPLPVGNFKWMDGEELCEWNSQCSNSRGCVLEVDLESREEFRS